MASKELIRKRLFIGIGFAIIGYFVAKKVLSNMMANKKPSVKGESNFASADGGNGGTFVSKQYDPNHVNSDGSKGATWISYNNSDVVGYWLKGQVKSDTIINSI